MSRKPLKLTGESALARPKSILPPHDCIVINMVTRHKGHGINEKFWSRGGIVKVTWTIIYLFFEALRILLKTFFFN